MKGENILNSETQNKSTLTLNPEVQKGNPLLDDVPVMQSVVLPIGETGYSAGTIDESMLSDEERKMVCNRRTPPDGFAEQNGRDAERAD